MALFGNNESRPVAKQGSPAGVPAGQGNAIGQGTVIEGTVQAHSDIRIGGKITGKVEAEGKVVVTPEGAIEGEVVATSADIAGKVQGEITVKDRLVLRSPAVVTGNVRTSKLVIEDGAVFSGKCDMSSVLAAASPAEPPEKVPGKTLRSLGSPARP